MNLADIFAAMSLGTILTGVAIALIQATIGLVNYRASKRTADQLGVSSQMLDWLTKLMLGPKRLDHEPMYSCVVSAVFLVGLFWLGVGPLPNSVIFTLPAKTQVTLATCLFLGSGTCLYGITMGTFTDAWRIVVRAKRGLFKEPSLPPLDIRNSYRVGASGIPAVFAGLIYYSAVLIKDTPLGWTGANAIFLIFVCMGLFFQWLRFLMENRRINQALPVLIEQELTRRAIASESDDTSTGPLRQEFP